MRTILERLIQFQIFQRLWRKFPIGDVTLRTDCDIWTRPDYAFGVYQACQLAASLGIKAVSAIEFGVAGGNGLVAIEEASAEISRHFNVEVQVFGFDGGSGMPAPIDYRDAAHAWGQGFYQMDEQKLRSRLHSAKLILGDVAKTVPRFMEELEKGVAPLGFVSFDLDYYSSTMHAFNIFKGSEKTRLPRTFLYFDDIIRPLRAYLNPFVGELLAINEYNAAHERQKIARIEHLAWLRERAAIWNDQMFVHHDFGHSLYTRCVTVKRDQQCPLH
jgi:hypothetical protein